MMARYTVRPRMPALTSRARARARAMPMGALDMKTSVLRRDVQNTSSWKSISS